MFLPEMISPCRLRLLILIAYRHANLDSPCTFIFKFSRGLSIALEKHWQDYAQPSGDCWTFDARLLHKYQASLAVSDVSLRGTLPFVFSQAWLNIIVYIFTGA